MSGSGLDRSIGAGLDRSIGAGLAALRKFATAPAARPGLDKCELCAAPLATGHEHLLEGARRLVCACASCSRLFPATANARYTRIERRAERVHVELSRALWEQLELPIGIAFVIRGATGARAIYPGAAGAIESTVPPEGWAALVAACPMASELRPDVEALLLDRMSPEPRVHRVSIDLAFELAGTLRRTWRGITGGDAAHGGLEEFLARLDAGEVCPCPT